jgi:hypothetical protein
LIMTTNNNKKKPSAARKLIPAIGMLTVSAMMLSSSTYAWFTMNKEVEIQNIQMTASAPTNVQLSLGCGMNAASLSTSTALTAIDGTTADGVGLVKAPENSDESLDWSNTVSFNQFYSVPLLSPASSNVGTTIWTTDAMTGVGKTILATGGTSVAGTAAALTLINDTSNAPTNPTVPAFNANNYVDFPVWLRTSSNAAMPLSVKAIVYEGDNANAERVAAGDTSKLYKAARVSILTSNAAATAPATSAGVVIPFDGGESTPTAQTSKYYAGKALSGTGAITSTGQADRGGAYGAITEIKQTGVDGVNTIVTLPASTNASNPSTNYEGLSADTSTVYGNATCVIVRVWLEGEDIDCWNATAGQNFRINLAFSEVPSA